MNVSERMSSARAGSPERNKANRRTSAACLRYSSEKSTTSRFVSPPLPLRMYSVVGEVLPRGAGCGAEVRGAECGGAGRGGERYEVGRASRPALRVQMS